MSRKDELAIVRVALEAQVEGNLASFPFVASNAVLTTTGKRSFEARNWAKAVSCYQIAKEGDHSIPYMISDHCPTMVSSMVAMHCHSGADT
jgi:hypothetical protein